jgi:hypothetical protein
MMVPVLHRSRHLQASLLLLLLLLLLLPCFAFLVLRLLLLLLLLLCFAVLVLLLLCFAPLVVLLLLLFCCRNELVDTDGREYTEFQAEGADKAPASEKEKDKWR